MTLKFTGIASTPSLDHYRHVVVAGAFDDSIKERGLGGPRGVKLLWQHERKPIGRITAFTTDNKGRLVMSAVIDDETGPSWAKDAAGAIRANGPLSLSIGAYLLDADFLTAPDGEDYIKILKMDLEEVSIVVAPGNEDCIIFEVEE